MTSDRRIPEGHPIDTIEKAKVITQLTGETCRRLTASCCVPLFWWATDRPGRDILHNGTVTLVQTPARVIGLTANHVIREALEAFERGQVCLQLADASAHELRARVIARSEELDLASVDVSKLIDQLGWPDKAPLRSWPPIAPEEGRGILIGGYPGIERKPIGPRDVSFGIFTAQAVARTVSEDQISCLFEREFMIEDKIVPTLPPNTDLGGISGGPVITVVESPGHFVTFRLGGIVSEAHPDLEKVYAKRIDLVQDDGRF